MIVAYYADSLGLPRPGTVKLEERYIYLFEKWLREYYGGDIFILNRARRAFTVDKLFEVYREDQEYITDMKDILIIHEGVCDCAPRPVPLYLRNFIASLPEFMKVKIIGFLHKNRAALLKKGFVHYLVDERKYENIFRQWLKNAVTQFERIYIFNIAPTNEGIELHSPGFQKSINAYNAIIEKV